MNVNEIFQDVTQECTSDKKESNEAKTSDKENEEPIEKMREREMSRFEHYGKLSPEEAAAVIIQSRKLL